MKLRRGKRANRRCQLNGSARGGGASAGQQRAWVGGQRTGSGSARGRGRVNVSAQVVLVLGGRGGARDGRSSMLDADVWVVGSGGIHFRTSATASLANQRTEDGGQAITTPRSTSSRVCACCRSRLLHCECEWAWRQRCLSLHPSARLHLSANI